MQCIICLDEIKDEKPMIKKCKCKYNYHNKCISKVKNCLYCRKALQFEEPEKKHYSVIFNKAEPLILNILRECTIFELYEIYKCLKLKLFILNFRPIEDISIFISKLESVIYDNYRRVRSIINIVINITCNSENLSDDKVQLLLIANRYR